jgi:hypothetical protein
MPRESLVGTLDQSQDSYNGVTASLGCPPSMVRGQTFTPSRSGALTRIDVAVGDTPRALVDVEVRETINGAPFGPVLATTTIDQVVDDGDRGWITATFDNPATVDAGTQYAFMLTVNPGCSEFLTLYGGSPNPYSNGSAWTSTVNAISNIIELPSHDWAFRTYVADIT